MLSLQLRHVNDVLIVSLSGKRVTPGPNDELFSELHHYIEKDRFYKIVFGLDAIEYLDSNGLGQMLRFMAKQKDAGRAIKIGGVNHHLIQLFKTIKLSSVVDIYDNEDAALASFADQASAAIS